MWAVAWGTLAAMHHNDRHGGADERAGAVICVLGRWQRVHVAHPSLPRCPAERRARGPPRRQGPQRGAAGTAGRRRVCVTCTLPLPLGALDLLDGHAAGRGRPCAVFVRWLALTCDECSPLRTQIQSRRCRSCGASPQNPRARAESSSCRRPRRRNTLTFRPLLQRSSCVQVCFSCLPGGRGGAQGAGPVLGVCGPM